MSETVDSEAKTATVSSFDSYASETVSVDNGLNDTETETAMVSDPVEAVRPKVSGWLLCVQGPSIGSSYEVYFGRNSVGRGSKDRVRIDTDAAVSRCQVYIIYDYDENEYVITPGDGTALTRLNGKRLDTSAPLNHGDFIALSKQTVLRFVPACDSAFRWIEEEE